MHPGSAALSAGNQHSRRRFLARAMNVTMGVALLTPDIGRSQPQDKTKMKICLTPGSIGVSANQMEAIALAERHGFEAVEPMGGNLASFTQQQISEIVASLKAKRLVWGAAGSPVEFRQDETKFNEGMNSLPKIASALAKAGVNRVGTWLPPAHN